MKQLIAIRQQAIGQQAINTVNARDLHAFLESKKDFSNWIKDRIEKYGFTEGADFLTVAQKGVGGNNGVGGRFAPIDYHLTLDMAKELSMVERNDKGKQARLYFLECEKVANLPQNKFQIPSSLPEALRLAADLAETNNKLQITLTEQAPKIEALKRITLTEGEFNITTVAKIINVRPTVLFEYLSTNGYIYRRLGGKEWVAYQTRVQQGLLLHRTLTVITPDGRERVIERCLVTPKGLAHIAEIFTTKPQQHISGSKKVDSRQTVIQ